MLDCRDRARSLRDGRRRCAAGAAGPEGRARDAGGTGPSSHCFAHWHEEPKVAAFAVPKGRVTRIGVLRIGTSSREACLTFDDRRTLKETGGAGASRLPRKCSFPWWVSGRGWSSPWPGAFVVVVGPARSISGSSGS
jgi:hypothetical protein